MTIYNAQSSMATLIEQFGGKKDVLLLFLLIVFLFLLCSLVKNNILRLLLASLFSLILCLQLASLYFTQSFVGYQFYVHANLRGWIGMQQLFVNQVIGILIFFFAFLTINFYAFFCFNELFEVLNSNRKRLLVNISKISCISIVLFSIVALDNFLIDTKTLLPIVTAGHSTNLEEVLKKYKMQDYTLSNEVKSTGGNNIIVISMESLERAFLGDKYASLTPNLNKLKNELNYFDLKQNSGSAWTSGSLYTCLTGFPAFFGAQRNNIFQSTYYTNISSISHALKYADYNITYLNGNADHAGIKEMLNVFQFDKIIDFKNTKHTGYESDYGIRDLDLFKIAKHEVKKLNDSEKSFAIFISTTDTHFPNGIYDERMESVISPKKSDLEFMVASLDYLIGDFMSFLQEQDILNNTSIFLFPDHLKMGDPSMFKNTGERSLYLITNSETVKPDSSTMYQIDLPKIILDGSSINHNLKFLTDYISGDKERYIKKNLLALTEINTNGILNSSIEVFNTNDVSNNYSNYCKDTARFIAHAGGKIDGKIYSNSKEALDTNYRKGFRLFELDIIETKDGEFVAAHDWKHWSKITNYGDACPVYHKEFISRKLHGKYTPLDMDAINKWFYEHQDAILITDKINDPIKFSALFIDKERLMMELFDEQSISDGLKSGILSAMPSQSVINTASKSDIKKWANKGIKDIAISRRFIANNKSILQEFKKYNIRTFVYHLNLDPGIDEDYVVKYEMDYIFGIYADEWNFE